jgi:hypothetical protein
VESPVPFTVQWYKDGHSIGSALHFRESGNATWHIDTATTKDEGYYVCNATNFAGYSFQETFLNVKGVANFLVRSVSHNVSLADPPPSIVPPLNVSAVPGEAVSLDCVAYSTVEHNITWFKKVKEYLFELNAVRSMTLKNGSLAIT